MIQVSFALRPGERFGLLGINGAGKSTTLNIVTGDIFPSAGEIYIAGRPMREEETRMMIGICFVLFFLSFFLSLFIYLFLSVFL